MECQNNWCIGFIVKQSVNTDKWFKFYTNANVFQLIINISLFKSQIGFNFYLSICLISFSVINSKMFSVIICEL